MNKLLTTFITATALAAAAGSTAYAQYAEPDAKPVVKTNERIAPQVKNTAAGSARLLLFASGSGSIVRSLNVDTVTNPTPGEYCIKPKKAFDVTTAVPSVSVEWSDSTGNGGVAEWRSSGAGCPAGDLDVLTFVLDSAGTSGLTQANGVAFSFVTP